MNIVQMSVSDARVLDLFSEPAVSLYCGFGFEITFQQGLYIQMEMNI